MASYNKHSITTSRSPRMKLLALFLEISTTNKQNLGWMIGTYLLNSSL